ncbi:metallophosphoesterase family protein [Paenibacillus sp. 1P07SE]|uniref:metallophosphoesterase family protein n=1 Tax=Paenibacillus sp. 1P07SE TaxID=3132209 RepID=UPI0039A4C393
MRIVVVSDTHMPAKARQLPQALQDELSQVDAILHAGDWTSYEVYDMLAAYAPVHGIAGNNDGERIVKAFGYRKIVTLEGKRIGLVHGHGRQGTTDSRAAEAFAGDNVDMVVFGHSHSPLYERRNGVILFNPGSPTDKRRQRSYSYGRLDITEQGISGEIVYFDRKE